MEVFKFTMNIIPKFLQVRRIRLVGLEKTDSKGGVAQQNQNQTRVKWMPKDPTIGRCNSRKGLVQFMSKDTHRSNTHIWSAKRHTLKSG